MKDDCFGFTLAPDITICSLIYSHSVLNDPAAPYISDTSSQGPDQIRK